jgi:sugar/nucleoside kinase (ribokinase family)
MSRINLVTVEQANPEQAELYAAIHPERELSGGSAANTMVGLADLGGTASFIGKVGNDPLGKIFCRELAQTGVEFFTPQADSDSATAQCVVLVTPDAQRTMNTFLGACVHVGPDDVDAETVAAAKVIYLEGYLWDLAPAKEAFLKAARLAHEADRQVALSLSDSFCVGRHRESFLEFVKNHVDLLFANEAEILALYQVDSLEEAIAQVATDCRTVAITRGAEGVVLLAEGQRHNVPAEVPRQLEDTTGAGDLFAAGFLCGQTQQLPLPLSGQIGISVATEIIAQFGARPERSLREVAAAHLV